MGFFTKEYAPGGEYAIHITDDNFRTAEAAIRDIKAKSREARKLPTGAGDDGLSEFRKLAQSMGLPRETSDFPVVELFATWITAYQDRETECGIGEDAQLFAYETDRKDEVEWSKFVDRLKDHAETQREMREVSRPKTLTGALVSAGFRAAGNGVKKLATGKSADERWFEDRYGRSICGTSALARAKLKGFAERFGWDDEALCDLSAAIRSLFWQDEFARRNRNLKPRPPVISLRPAVPSAPEQSMQIADSGLNGVDYSGNVSHEELIESAVVPAFRGIPPDSEYDAQAIEGELVDPEDDEPISSLSQPLQPASTNALLTPGPLASPRTAETRTSAAKNATPYKRPANVNSGNFRVIALGTFALLLLSVFLMMTYDRKSNQQPAVVPMTMNVTTAPVSAVPALTDADIESLSNRETPATPQQLLDAMQTLEDVIGKSPSAPGSDRLYLTLGRLKDRYMRQEKPAELEQYAKRHPAEFVYYEPGGSWCYNGRQFQLLLDHFPSSTLAHEAAFQLRDRCIGPAFEGTLALEGVLAAAERFIAQYPDSYHCAELFSQVTTAVDRLLAENQALAVPAAEYDPVLFRTQLARFESLSNARPQSPDRQAALRVVARAWAKLGDSANANRINISIGDPLIQEVTTTAVTETAAAPIVVGDNRVVWHSPSGDFRNVDKGIWKETNAGGAVIVTYTEVSRTPDEIEIIDPRRCSVRLQANQSWIRCADTGWGVGRPGYWLPNTPQR